MQIPCGSCQNTAFHCRKHSYICNNGFYWIKSVAFCYYCTSSCFLMRTKINTVIPNLAHLRVQEIQSTVWITNADVEKTSTTFGNRNSDGTTITSLQEVYRFLFHFENKAEKKIIKHLQAHLFEQFSTPLNKNEGKYKIRVFGMIK